MESNSLTVIWFVVVATNEGDAAQGVGEIRTYAHDWYQLVGLAKRTCAGNETRDIDVLQSSGQFHWCQQTSQSFIK